MTRKSPPRITARGRGQISSRLQLLAVAYRDNNEGRDCRWVYAPEHSAHHSKVMQRMAEGYRKVTYEELGNLVEELNLNGEDTVRVGDLMLMSIEEARRRESILERQERAREDMRRVQREFYDAIESIEVVGASGAKRRGQPLGSATIEEVERELNLSEES